MVGRPGSFVPFMLDFKGRSANDQAKAILNEVQRQHAAGAQHVGITYSANSTQTQAINAAYAANNYQTGTNGAFQAAVMREVEQLLADDANYQGLQGVFRILPVTTMHQNRPNDPPGTIPTADIQRDLGNIASFASQQNNVVLGWQNSTSGPNGYAIGGGTSKVLDDDQKALIQGQLQTIAAAHPPLLAAAPVPPPTPQAAQQQSHANEAENFKRLEANKAEWEKHHKYIWEKIDLSAELVPDENKVTMSAEVGPNGARPSHPFVESGFYRSTRPEDKKVASLYYDKDKKEVSMSTPWYGKQSSADYGNGRDFLQSQGVNHILFDFGNGFNTMGTLFSTDTKETRCAEVVKYLLDSIYEGWEGKVDRNGYEKGQGNFTYKEPPLAITLGENLKKYITNHLDEKNIFGKPTRAAKLAFRLAQLEALSQDRLLQHEKQLANKKDAEPAPANPAEPVADRMMQGGQAAQEVDALPQQPQNAVVVEANEPAADPAANVNLPADAPSRVDNPNDAKLRDGEDPVFKAVKDVASAFVDQTKAIDPSFDSSEHKSVLDNAQAPERTLARPVDVTDFDAKLETMVEQHPDAALSFDTNDLLQLHNISKSLGEDDSHNHQEKESIREVLKEFVEKTLNDPFEKADLMDKAIEKLKELKAPEATIEAFENQFKPQSLSPSPNK